MGKICAALMGDSLEVMVSKSQDIKSDIIEFRLDLISKDSDFSLLKKVKKPLMATCMPIWEGGSFEGAEDERALILHKALDYSSYVSVELNMGGSARAALISAAKARGVKSIVTHHDFKKTPPIKELLDVLGREKEAGADISKIAYMPHSDDDVLNVLSTLVVSDVGIPIIALSMGELGSYSRILAPMLGSYLSFAAADERGTAPGQFTVSQMKKYKRLLWK